MREHPTIASFSIPCRLQVEVTSRCNMRCAMCVKYAEGCHIPEADLPLEAFHQLGDTLRHCEALVLNGIGEPLLHPDLAAMAAFASERMPQDAMLGFQTNGLLLTPTLAKELVIAGVNTVCISMDTLDAENGTSAGQNGGNSQVELHGQAKVGRIARAFGLLRNAAREAGKPMRLGMECVLMGDTWPQLPALVRWAGEHGVDFLIGSHMLPYHGDMAHQSVFNPNTPKATAIFAKGKARAQHEGLDLHGYFGSPWKFIKTDQDIRLGQIVKEMQEEAAAQGVWIHVLHLLEWDRKDMSGLHGTYAEAREVALEAGIELRLPPLQAVDDRRCHFVEQDTAFVTATGNVSPCQFLWHDCSCHMDGQRKRIEPWYFGNIADTPLTDIWNSPEFIRFREQVLDYEYPYCANCSFVPCDDITGTMYHFENDCLGHTVPCGHCLWCMGGLQCLL